MSIAEQIRKTIKDRQTEVRAFRVTKQIARKKESVVYRKSFVDEKLKLAKEKGKEKARRGNFFERGLTTAKSNIKKNKGKSAKVNFLTGDTPDWLK